MASIININNGMKESTGGYENCNSTQIVIFGGYFKVRESFYTRVVIWVNTILNCTDTEVNLTRYKGSHMVFRPEWYPKETTLSNIHTLPVKKK